MQQDQFGPRWAEIQALETHLLRQLTVEQGVQQFLALQREFEPQLQATDSIFRPQRIAALTQLQERLAALAPANGGVMHDLMRSVADLQQRLDDADIPSAVIGGLAVSAWGAPHLTRAADLKVLARRDERRRLLQLLADFTPLHADPDAAFRRHGIAFFLDPAGVRVDVMLAETSFDESAIARARPVVMSSGLAVRVCSAEALLVYKMLSTRTQDRTDVESIITRQGGRLDAAYVERWLRLSEQDLDDSTLVTEFRRLTA